MNCKELAGKDWRVQQVNVHPNWRHIPSEHIEWFVIEYNGNNREVVAECRSQGTANQIAALPKLVEAIKLAIQYGENEYVETELDDALAALEVKRQ